MAARKKKVKTQVIVDEDYLDALEAFKGDVDDVLENGILAEDFETLKKSITVIDKLNSGQTLYTPPKSS